MNNQWYFLFDTNNFVVAIKVQICVGNRIELRILCLKILKFPGQGPLESPVVIPPLSPPPNEMEPPLSRLIVIIVKLTTVLK